MCLWGMGWGLSTTVVANVSTTTSVRFVMVALMRISLSLSPPPPLYTRRVKTVRTVHNRPPYLVHTFSCRNGLYAPSTSKLSKSRFSKCYLFSAGRQFCFRFSSVDQEPLVWIYLHIDLSICWVRSVCLYVALCSLIIADNVITQLL